MTPDMLPRGFAETADFEFKPLLWEISYGEIFDAGIHDYGEFFVSLEYGLELLQAQQVPFDTGDGRLDVAYRYTNGVQLKWHPKHPRWRWPV